MEDITLENTHETPDAQPDWEDKGDGRWTLELVNGYYIEVVFLKGSDGIPDFRNHIIKVKSKSGLVIVNTKNYCSYINDSMRMLNHIRYLVILDLDATRRDLAIIRKYLAHED